MSASLPPGRWWREPLVHFIVIGALLFLAFERWGVGSAGASRILITPGQVDAIVANFQRTWQRPPTEDEVRNLVADQVREEIATREAMALGLDKDDTVIRRRLRQKFEFAAEDVIDGTPPTEAELQQWLQQHADAYRQDPSFAFTQVYLSPERRAGRLEADAATLLARLQATGSPEVEETVGDRLMVPRDVPLAPLTDVARQFGDDFARGLMTMPTGSWAGPVRSGFGAHLVFVRQRVPGRLPPLADVLPLVSRDFAADRRKRQLDDLYTRLSQRYTVVIEPRAPSPTAVPAPGGGAR